MSVAAAPPASSPRRRIMISCGEASGDLYAEALVRALRAADPGVEVFGFGGDRMRAERQREAAEFRAEGTGAASRIKANADREVTIIKAEAMREGERTRGEGDAERNRIFADAFGRDPDFFAFYRSMQAYEQGFKAGDTRMLLAPDSEFFKYFTNPLGNGNTAAQPKR